MQRKAVICLDGNSSAIKNKSRILTNIRYVLDLFQIAYEVYETRKDGFKKMYDDMNRSNTLYILNDSLCYHFCEQPCILLSRSIPWVTSSVKPNCIGRITHEMMETDVTFLSAILYRNKPMRQEADEFAAFTYLIANDFEANIIETIGRHGASQWSWAQVAKWDMHFKISLNTQPEPAKINEVLADGIDLLKHPDDILIVTNRDICLVKEATGILRAYMDTMDIDCCYAHRVDVRFNGLLNFDSIYNKQPSSGIDFFAFRAGQYSIINNLLSTDLLIGRVGWDTLWASKIKNRLPFNICYHYPHESHWQKKQAIKENNYNIESIIEADPNLKISADSTKAWFEKI